MCHFFGSGGFEMELSDTQVFVALAIALLPGFLAFRLSTELYK